MFPLLSQSLGPDALRPELERLSEKAARLHAGMPLPPAFAESLEHKLSIELTHGSNAIEGNTLSLRETQLLIDEGITPAGAKSLREIYETLNHHKALGRLREFVQTASPIAETALGELHTIIMQQIDSERGGVYRRDPVFVTGAPIQPIRAEKIREAMSELVVWLGQDSSDLHPVIRTAEAHYRFVKIHPFYDGNGRTGRLLLNWILLTRRYPLAVIESERRSQYLHALDDADRGKPELFLRLICECVERSLDQYLAR